MKLLRSIKNNSIGLGLFALVTVGIIALAYMKTAPLIADSIDRVKIKALQQIIPPDRYNNDLLSAGIHLPDPQLLGIAADQQGFIGKYNSQPVAVILPLTTTEGYTADIDILVGIATDGSIIGVRVITHKETPGLGDKIDIKKSPWILSFDNRSLTNTPLAQWQVRKQGGDFDQFTGATITPRAVIHAVRDALQYFAIYQHQLLAE